MVVAVGVVVVVVVVVGGGEVTGTSISNIAISDILNGQMNGINQQ